MQITRIKLMQVILPSKIDDNCYPNVVDKKSKSKKCMRNNACHFKTEHPA